MDMICQPHNTHRPPLLHLPFSPPPTWLHLKQSQPPKLVSTSWRSRHGVVPATSLPRCDVPDVTSKVQDATRLSGVGVPHTIIRLLLTNERRSWEPIQNLNYARLVSLRTRTTCPMMSPRETVQIVPTQNII